MHRRLAPAFLRLLPCLVSLAHAQQPLVIRAAHMVDVTRGELISPAVVVITGGKISNVGSGGVPVKEE